MDWYAFDIYRLWIALGHNPSIAELREEYGDGWYQEMVDILRRRATLMVNPVIGSAVNAKQSQLDRLVARQIKAPFIEVREPEIILPVVGEEPAVTEGEEVLEAAEAKEVKPVLSINNYQVNFDKDLLENVNFELMPGEKVAIVGGNGTGKTTLIKDILKNDNPAIHIDENIKYACLSQLQGETSDADRTVYQLMQDHGFGSRTSIIEYLEKYCIDEEYMDQKVGNLSGGEQNILQIAIIANSGAELLILDEPTSHLDIHAQVALERAIAEYKGAVLMVSHDFYLVANTADYVLLVADNTVRRIRTRNFRKMVYDNHFDPKYLEIDRKKQQLEMDIALAFKNGRLVTVEKLCNQLEEISLA